MLYIRMRACANFLLRDSVTASIPSICDMQMSLDTPYHSSRMSPIRALEALSSRVLQATLKACMGPYLDRLIGDYEDWAEGRPRRQQQIQPHEASQLFLEAEASAVEGFAAVKRTGTSSTTGIADTDSDSSAG